jgi:hypothetical protein
MISVIGFARAARSLRAIFFSPGSGWAKTAAAADEA